MYKILPVVFLVILWGCSPVKKLQKENNTTASADTSNKIFRSTATKSWELLHTDIDISFNLEERTASATAALSLHPYFYPTDSVLLDAKDMKILKVVDGNQNDLSFRYDTAQLNIRLPRTYQRSDTLKLIIQYIAMPYAAKPGGGSAIMEDRGLYFINTDHAEPYKPVQVWTQGETESNSHWFPTFDKPNFRSTFEITMHVPDSFITLSNGVLVRSVEEKDHLKAVTWRQDIPIPPYLVMMAAGNFYEAKESWNGKEVNYYVPQSYAAYAKNIFRHTPEMIDYFSKLLKVPYPWNKYSQVIVYDYVSGAMENVSASLFGAFNLKDDRELKDYNNDFIIAHELFHQWFGDYVTCESWSQITLNESFADFSEMLWSAYKYGEDQAQVQQIQNLNRYLTQARTSDPPLVRFYYDSELDVFDRVSYSKGGLILNYLKHVVGDSAFFDALHLYLTQNALHSAEASQLRLSFEAVTGQDLHWFFNEWYYRGGHPELSVHYTYDDEKREVTAIVDQEQNGPLYRLPLKAAIIRNGHLEKVDWLIKDKQQIFTYPYGKDQRPVIIPDAGHWLPGELNDQKEAWQWITQMKHADDLMGRYFALLAVTNPKINKDSVALIYKLALKDKAPFIRSRAITMMSFDQVKQSESSLGDLAQNDPDDKVRSAALYRLAEIKAPAYISTYEMAVTDSSYEVAAAGLTALDALNHSRAVDNARCLIAVNSRSALWLTTAGKVIGADGKASDYPFYENTILHLFEQRRELFIDAFVLYLNHVQDEQLYKRGIRLIQEIAGRNASSRAAFMLSSSLYRLYQYAEKKQKIATSKSEAESWKQRRDQASKAWSDYKGSVTDQSILALISQLEQESN